MANASLLLGTRKEANISQTYWRVLHVATLSYMISELSNGSDAGIGLYNAITYDAKVFAAISPHHAVKFFARNNFDGWRMLGGILLCVTGTEAMFADLGHFSVTAIQVNSELPAAPQMLLCKKRAVKQSNSFRLLGAS